LILEHVFENKETIYSCVSQSRPTVPTHEQWLSWNTNPPVRGCGTTRHQGGMRAPVPFNSPWIHQSVVERPTAESNSDAKTLDSDYNG